jgi:exodeoxyribonuclease VII large subunit
MVAIGHEVDVSLAELAADRRGSTPSNAAELLVPDRREALERLAALRLELADEWFGRLDDLRQELADVADDSLDIVTRRLERERTALDGRRQLVAALDPALALRRGFAIVRGGDGRALRRGSQVRQDAIVRIELADVRMTARIEDIEGKV